MAAGGGFGLPEDLFHPAGGFVDVVRRGRGAEAEPQAAGDGAVVESHSQKYRGRLARPAGTGGAGGAGDACQVESDRERPAIETEEGDIGDVRQTVGGAAVDGQGWPERAQALLEPVAQGGEPPGAGLDIPEGDSQCDLEADDEGERLGSGAQTGLLKAAPKLRR